MREGGRQKWQELVMRVVTEEVQGDSILSKCFCCKTKDKVPEVSNPSKNSTSRVPPSHENAYLVHGWDTSMDGVGGKVGKLVRNTIDEAVQHRAGHQATHEVKEYIDWQPNLGNNIRRMSQGNNDEAADNSSIVKGHVVNEHDRLLPHANRSMGIVNTKNRPILLAVDGEERSYEDNNKT
ncbi:hypothetical protein Ancab_035715 [Ancistrocladus abbreviatus]